MKEDRTRGRGKAVIGHLWPIRRKVFELDQGGREESQDRIIIIMILYRLIIPLSFRSIGRGTSRIEQLLSWYAAAARTNTEHLSNQTRKVIKYILSFPKGRVRFSDIQI